MGKIRATLFLLSGLTFGVFLNSVFAHHGWWTVALGTIITFGVLRVSGGLYVYFTKKKQNQFTILIGMLMILSMAILAGSIIELLLSKVFSISQAVISSQLLGWISAGIMFCFLMVILYQKITRKK